MIELCSDIRRNVKAIQIVEKFKKVSRSAANDIAIALNCMTGVSPNMEFVISRLELTHTMCMYMEPDVEDVVSLLLHSAYGNGKVTEKTFRDLFRADRFDRYHKWMVDAFKNAPRQEGKERIAQIDYYVMMRVCERMKNAIIRTMNKKGIPEAEDILDAYEFAKTAHYGVSRKSGEPYLSHPICVAQILAEAGLESSIIAAALLHDVVEDSEYTVADVSDRCGKFISKLVDSVTSVHKEYEASHHYEEYTRDKSQLDAMSFEKLAQAVEADSRMLFALYIKAADRIHNLRTIDKMSSLKKHYKTDETELDYLPLFRRFHLNYFVNIIEDLAWRTNNAAFYEAVKAAYEEMTERNREYIEEMRQILMQRLGEEFNTQCSLMGMDDGGYDVTIEVRRYLTKEVYNFVRESLGSDHEVGPKDVNKRTTPICDFDIIVEPRHRSSMDTFIAMFVKIFSDSIASTGRTIIDLEIDRYNRFIVNVEDRHRCVFRLCFATGDDHLTYKFGSSAGANRSGAPDPVEDDPRETIQIYLRNGKMILLPNGATVLDAAFAIHPQIGITAVSALVNGGEADIYNKLHDGDHVVINADTYRDENGIIKKLIPHVRLSWLNSVVTEKAKRAIIRRLSKRYEGEDPKSEFPASDVAVSNVSSGLMKSLEKIPAFNKID